MRRCQKSFTRKSEIDCIIKIVQHCIKTNVQLVWPYPLPKMAYNLQWGCLLATLHSSSIYLEHLQSPFPSLQCLASLASGPEILLGRPHFRFRPMGTIFASSRQATYPRRMAMCNVCLQWPLLIPTEQVQNQRFVLRSTFHRHWR